MTLTNNYCSNNAYGIGVEYYSSGATLTNNKMFGCSANVYTCIT
ncbi:MAG: hypothetical protein ACTSSN_11930 [Candidatus Heimdallarchaeaceae archaeon]